MAKKRKYAEKFKDPRWQMKRLRIFERDRQLCQKCFDPGDPEAPTTLHVHHRYYRRWGTDPWDYPDEALVTLCEPCHEEETATHSEARQRLQEVVFSNLWAGDVERLLAGLEAVLSGSVPIPRMEKAYWAPYDFSDMLEWLLTDEEARADVMWRHFEHLYPGSTQRAINRDDS